MNAMMSLSPELSLRGASASFGVSRSTVYRHRTPPRARIATRTPPLQLSLDERHAIRSELMSARFVDKPPTQVYACLLDEGRYLCSIRTMYRLLAAEHAVRERRDQRVHAVYSRPELIAQAPNQVWSWDITKLKTTVKWTYFYLYVIVDIFSRYVVGWSLHTRETGALARDFVETCLHRENVARQQLTLHADRGAPMRSKTLNEMLVDLGIDASFSRPQVSNDNPFSESLFKTLKYTPVFPECFASAEHARRVLVPFFEHYNQHHHHSGIGLMTPEAVHHGRDKAITAARALTLQNAFENTPKRFKGKQPKPPKVPAAVYINPPLSKEIITTKTH